MDVAKWTCTGCKREWEGEWTDEAWLMASECPYCKAPGISSKNFSRPAGTLSVKNEKELAGSGV